MKRWRRTVVGLQDAISFSAHSRYLVGLLNQEMREPRRLPSRLSSHPAGFVRAVAKRRLTMAESYLKLVSVTSVDDYEERLRALRELVHLAWHAKTLALPLTTARVQIALMKECIQSKGDLPKQLALMTDFSRASFGQPSVIRRLLKRLELLETPDDGRPLRAIGLGRDGHVHDSLTLGRKTPSQLMVDAFVKGIGAVTVAYYDLTDPRVYTEVLEAGAILGIQVQVALELSVGPAGQRKNLLVIPPQDGSPERIRRFVEEHAEALDGFFEGITANAARRGEVIAALLDDFVRTVLPELNARYEALPSLCIPAIEWEDVAATIHGRQASRIHAAQVITLAMRPVLHKRVLYLKNQLRHARERSRRVGTPSWELETIATEYERARDEYEQCHPYRVLERFLDVTGEHDYDSAFATMEALRPIKEAGGRIVFIHPLSVGLEEAVATIVRYHDLIDEVEVFNLFDATRRDPAVVERLCHVVDLLTRGDGSALANELEAWDMEMPPRTAVEEAAAHFSVHGLQPRVGSDYAGVHPTSPGMGFVYGWDAPAKTRRAIQRRRHLTLPQSVADVVAASATEGATIPVSQRHIYTIRPPQPAPKNSVGDEEARTAFGPLTTWRYLNPWPKGSLKVLMGFLPAFFVIGPWYTLLWLGITAFRNAVADLISSAGMNVKTWHLDTIDWENLTTSVFWTGFSVPILAAAKHGFDVGWAMIGPDIPWLASIVKFFVISSANGLYIASHNTIRGFQPKVIRANFFRSVLAWPLATLGSFGLDLLAIPAIVQTKVWSDVVAGIIEGLGKFSMRRALRERDLEELLHTLADDAQDRRVVVADILYVWSERDRGKTVLGQLVARARKAPPAQEVSERSDDDRLRRGVHALAAYLTRQGGMEELTTLILDHYEGGDAVKLTEFVGAHYAGLAQWLEQRSK